ncbi:MAG: hypothetical protein RR855_18165 [Comamonas sp.]
MPRKQVPATPETQIDTTVPQSPSDPGNAGKLPHERDQSVDATNRAPDPQMQQAYRDLQKGLVDTDARGASGRPLDSKAPAEGAVLHDRQGRRKPKP